MNEKKLSQSGVALLMSLGILALLSILGATFSTNMRLMERTTRDFIYEVEARYLAEAGVEYAVAELKQDARSNFVFTGINNDPNATDRDKIILPNAQSSLPTGNSIEITVIDTARRVNINNANSKLLQCIPDVGSGTAGNIISQRGTLPFITKQSVCLAGGLGYNSIKDLINFSTYKDPNVQNGSDANGPIYTQRSAVNINTLIKDARGGDANAEDLLKNMFKVVDGVGDTRAGNIVTALKNTASFSDPNCPWIKSWGEFNRIINNVSGIGSTLGPRIEATFNPNRPKPELSKQPNVPTEFCFHSGGTYEIDVTANITRGAQIIASKRMTAIVNLFNIWNMTKRSQFRNEGGNYPSHGRVTWFDSCPITVNTCYNSYSYDSNNTILINDSLKLGYWDDFSEDTDYTNSIWTTINSPTGISGGELFGGGSISSEIWPLISLGNIVSADSYKWRWEYYSVRVHLRNSDHTMYEHYAIGGPTGPQRFYDVGAHLVLSSLNNPFRHNDVFISEADPQSEPPHPINNHENYYLPEPYLWVTNAGIWPAQHSSALPSYYPEKTFYVLTTGNGSTDTCSATAYVPGGESYQYARSYGHNSVGENGKGLLIFYGANSNFYADNLRIIGSNGFYESIPINLSTEICELGTIWGTETIPPTANGASEKVAFQISIDGTNWYPGINQFNEIDNQLQPEGGSIYSTLQPVGLSPNINSIRYRANFVSSDQDYSETPVLEDVWITYLPRTRVLYWREN